MGPNSVQLQSRDDCASSRLEFWRTNRSEGNDAAHFDLFRINTNSIGKAI